MVKLLPQELQVRYILPAIRKEIAKILISDHEMKQKEVAAALGMTDAAISQYLSSKRGSELVFTIKEKKVLKTVAQKISQNKELASELIYKASLKLNCPESLCELHKALEDVPNKCDLCK